MKVFKCNWDQSCFSWSPASNQFPNCPLPFIVYSDAVPYSYVSVLSRNTTSPLLSSFLAAVKAFELTSVVRPFLLFYFLLGSFIQKKMERWRSACQLAVKRDPSQQMSHKNDEQATSQTCLFFLQLSSYPICLLSKKKKKSLYAYITPGRAVEIREADIFS